MTALVLALAAQTSTVAASNPSPIDPGTIEVLRAIIAAYQLGVLPGLALTLPALAGLLMWPPIARWFDRQSFDWVQPGLLLLLAIGEAVIAALISVGGDWILAVLAGFGTIAASGALIRRFVRDWNDKPAAEPESTEVQV